MASSPPSATASPSDGAPKTEKDKEAPPSEAKLPAVVTKFIQDLKDRKITMVIFDMDKTITGLHTRGVIEAKDIAKYKKSIGSDVSTLLPALIVAGFTVCIATLSDGLYCSLLKANDLKAGRAPKNYLAGLALVSQLIQSIPGMETQEKDLLKLTLNPDLYIKRNNPKIEAAYLDKLRNLKVDVEAVQKKRDSWTGTQWKEESDERILDFPPPKHKTAHLRIIKAITHVPYENMVLLDDKLDNCASAKALGAYAVHIPGRESLKYQHLASIDSPLVVKAVTPPVKAVAPPS